MNSAKNQSDFEQDLNESAKDWDLKEKPLQYGAELQDWVHQQLANVSITLVASSHYGTFGLICLLRRDARLEEGTFLSSSLRGEERIKNVRPMLTRAPSWSFELDSGYADLPPAPLPHDRIEQHLTRAILLNRDKQPVSTGKAILYHTLHRGEFYPPENLPELADSIRRQASILKTSDGLYCYRLQPDDSICQVHANLCCFQFGFVIVPPV